MAGEKCDLLTNENFLALKTRVDMNTTAISELKDEVRGIKEYFTACSPAVDLTERTAVDLKDFKQETHNQLSHITSTIGSHESIVKTLADSVDKLADKVSALDMSESKSIERDFHIMENIKSIKEDFSIHTKEEMNKYDNILTKLDLNDKASEARHEKADKKLEEFIKNEHKPLRDKYDKLSKQVNGIVKFGGGIMFMSGIAWAILSNFDKIKDFFK